MTAALPRQIQRQSRYPWMSGSLYELSHVTCRVISQPLEQLGGDYYDVFELGGGRVGFVLADVSAKGPSGALLTARLQEAFRVQPVELLARPADLIGSVSRMFHSQARPGDFATAFYGVYDADADALIYVNCGHPPAVICKPDGAVIRCDAAGARLGLAAEAEWVEHYADVQPGDRIVVCSDGILDADVILDDRTQVEIEVRPNRWIQ